MFPLVSDFSYQLTLFQLLKEHQLKETPVCIPLPYFKFYVDTEERLCLNIKYGGFVFILIQGVGWFDFNCILYKIQDVVICNEMKKLF